MITIIVTVLVLVYKSFCNTVCIYGHANKASCCRCCCSRINWYENGEKNSKYFLNLEKTRRGKTAVRRLHDSTGKNKIKPQIFN